MCGGGNKVMLSKHPLFDSGGANKTRYVLANFLGVHVGVAPSTTGEHVGGFAVPRPGTLNPKP